MRWILICFLMMSLSACAIAGEQATTTPMPPALIGEVAITAPRTGSIIYAEALYITGISSDLPATGFVLSAILPNDDILFEMTIQPEADSWQTEVIHNYVGDPTEITLLARATDPQVVGEYDVVSVVLATVALRPEGIFASILFPSESDAVGGDFINVSGIASGLPENQMTLELLRSDDDVLITRVPITLTNPYFVDEVAWSADVMTQRYTGTAILHLYYESPETGEKITLDRLTITINQTAG